MDASQNSLVGLLRVLREDATSLFRQEVALVKTEIKHDACTLANATGLLIAAYTIGGAALVVLAMGISQLLRVRLEHSGMGPVTATWVAPGGIGLLLGAVGCLLFLRAKKALLSGAAKTAEALDTLKSDQ